MDTISTLCTCSFNCAPRLKEKTLQAAALVLGKEVGSFSRF